MKIGKQPKRWGKPSAAFQARQQAARPKEENKFDTVEEETPLPSEDVPDTNEGVKIYLDDERPCPEGWTLARTPREFFELLRQGDEFLARVTEISLDWYLGSRQVDGVEVSKKLAYYFCEAAWDGKPPYMPNLKRMYFHSSDREQARRMATIFNETFEDSEVGRSNIRLRLGRPL